VTNGWDNPPYKSLNLYIRGVDRGSWSAVLNLNIRAQYPGVGASLPLLIENHVLRTDSDLLLYIAGDGVTPGAIPFGADLNLYVQRGPNGGIPLYIANNWAGASLPLFVACHPSVGGQAPLFIQGMGGDVSQSMTLVIPEVSAPLTVNAQVPMSIPKVVGRQPNSVPLYVVGWKP
jgi:hypothetical protein